MKCEEGRATREFPLRAPEAQSLWNHAESLVIVSQQEREVGLELALGTTGSQLMWAAPCLALVSCMCWREALRGEAEG